MVEHINQFVLEIKSIINYEHVLMRFMITGNKIDANFFKVENDNEVHFDVDSKVYRMFALLLFNDYKLKLDDLEKRYNVFELEVFSDNQFIEKYHWKDDKEYQDKAKAAKIFYHWINEMMMNRIFDHEKENNLLPTKLTDEDKLEYLKSWDKGVFTFKIIDQKLKYEIELCKNDSWRTLDIELGIEYTKPIINHYKDTNEVLKKEWQSWNTLVIKSPNNEIAKDSKDDFVIYSFEDYKQDYS